MVYWSWYLSIPLINQLCCLWNSPPDIKMFPVTGKITHIWVIATLCVCYFPRSYLLSYPPPSVSAFLPSVLSSSCSTSNVPCLAVCWQAAHWQAPRPFWGEPSLPSWGPRRDSVTAHPLWRLASPVRLVQRAHRKQTIGVLLCTSVMCKKKVKRQKIKLVKC